MPARSHSGVSCCTDPAGCKVSCISLPGSCCLDCWVEKDHGPWWETKGLKMSVLWGMHFFPNAGVKMITNLVI